MTTPVLAPSSEAGAIPDEAGLARDLRRHKMRATGLLLFATAVFVATRIFTDGQGWAGYVEAAAEAAMVGGMADWFAVTALFRRPLHLPIPHTAIIPERKDEIGRALGDFVQHNFLRGDVLSERLGDIDIAGRFGAWLERPDNAERVAAQASSVVEGIVEVMRDDEIQSTIYSMVRKRVDQVSLAPVAGQVLDFALEGDHHRALFDATLRGVSTMLEDNRYMLRQRMEQESPWWVPESVDQALFDRIYAGVQKFVEEIRVNPTHEMRATIDDRIRRLSRDLKESPEFAQRAEELKNELFEDPRVQEWTNNLWLHIKASLLEATEDPNSDLRIRLRDAAVSAGAQLQHDPSLKDKVNRWSRSVAVHLANESSNEVADLISSTVESWDPIETSDRIELQIGRDLQFIRINGTVVGGLVGVVIHAVGQLLG